MADYRHLARAPITEAVLDFGVHFPRKVEQRDLEKFGARVAGAFPNRKSRLEMRFTVGTDQGKAETNVQPVGYLFNSQDEKYIVHCKPDGFAFSRLAPYETWSKLTAAAWEPWEQYRDEFGPKRVSRLSTRFINRLTLPGIIDFDDYLTIAPRLPTNVPQFLSAFSTATAIPFVAEKSVALVRASFDSAAAPEGTAVVILDIDVVRDCDLAPDDDAGIRRTIEGLRKAKNDLFFGSLTEKALEFFT